MPKRRAQAASPDFLGAILFEKLDPVVRGVVNQTTVGISIDNSDSRDPQYVLTVESKLEYRISMSNGEGIVEALRLAVDRLEEAAKGRRNQGYR